MSDIRPIVLGVLLLSAGSAWPADFVSLSGRELYDRFCASCHGAEGRGDGPVSSSLKIEVPDLTLLARRSGGSYPRDRVVRIIDGRYIIGAHGSRTMPVWGEDFSRAELGDPNAEQATQVVIDRLADYVAQLQHAARP